MERLLMIQFGCARKDRLQLSVSIPSNLSLLFENYKTTTFTNMEITF